MTTLRLRIVFDGAMLGPGKADLLDRIAKTGSISAAGREMGMSYKRAWLLVEELNAAFYSPLVASARGGRGVGGAHLTDMGVDVLRHYRAIEVAASQAAASDVAALEAMLSPDADMSGGK